MCKSFRGRTEIRHTHQWEGKTKKDKKKKSCNGRQDVKSHLTPQILYIKESSEKKKLLNKPVHPNTFGI